jgi:hypothetical protein
MEAGVQPTDALQQVKEKLFTVMLRDRSSLGSSGRPVRLG